VNETENELANQLRAAILDCGRTMNSIAVAVKIPQPCLWRFVHKGTYNLSLDNANKLCQYFGMRLTKPKRNMLSQKDWQALDK